MHAAMKEEGVPEENIFVHGPGVTDRRLLGLTAILTHPVNARQLCAETLVVNLSSFPLFRSRQVDAIADNNIVVVNAAGNVTRGYENECDPEDMPDRDLWHPGHSFHFCNKERGDSVYRQAMQAIETGKVLIATSADIQQDGSVEPDLRVIKCGDLMASCFALPHAAGLLTSGATAQLSAAVFHLFQLYEDAGDVVRALKRCARDIGEPGIDREFGNGLVDFRCVEATRPVIGR